MHDEEGPRRLRQGADTPENLLRALTALRKGVDDSARLQRVGQKLEAALSSPPSAAHLPARRGLFGQKLSGIKLLLGGLGLLAPLFFFQLMDDVTTVPSGDRAGSSQPSAAPLKLEETAPTATAEVEQPAIVAPAVATEATAEELQPTTKRSSRSSHAAASRPRKRSTSQEESPRVEPELALKTDAIDAPITDLSAHPSNDEAQAPPAVPAVRQQLKPAATEEAPRVSEADLLLKARQALKRDPALALRLASEHQAQYANGRLVPEREVLAIEALRNLGRKQEADERLHKFEARYPDSIHLKRLHEPR